MRAALLAAVLVAAACDTEEPAPSGDDPCGDACASGLECTRTGECLPASEIRAVHVTWTVYARPASDETCTTAPRLWIKLRSFATDASVGFAPVPCKAGAFTIDKLGRELDNVEIGIDASGELDGQPILSDGTASFDLHL